MMGAMCENWYAVYTLPRWEKQVEVQLRKLGFETWLPLQVRESLWSDRWKKVEIPFISSYVFVKCKQTDFVCVLSVRGVVMFLCERKDVPLILKNEWLEGLKYMLENGYTDLQFVEENYAEGDAVEVVRGKFRGLIGEIVEKDGKHRFVLRLGRWGCITASVAESCMKKL